MNLGGDDSQQGTADIAPTTGPLVSSGDDSLRVTLSIALAVGIGSMSFNFWYPFMPLYLLRIGAHSEADALFWVAVATTVQGIARLATGPLWGIASDRVGRKLMLLRALYLATPTTIIAAFVQEPWQISLALAFQGLFSGFVPAAVALTSVSVPDSRLNSSLSIVTGAQYLGTTVGPAVGALLAVALGFRGAILFAACLPTVAATLVFLLVRNDKPRVDRRRDEPKEKLEPFRPSRQLTLVIFFFFVIFSMTQLIRLVTPIALRQIQGDGDVEGITGIAFTLAGLASAVSVLVVAPRFFRVGYQRQALLVCCVVCAVAYLLLAETSTVVSYVVVFALISLLQAAMIPPTNTLIAANAPRARRGTAFGWAGSAQALAFVAGPMGAALFGAVSLDLGFVVLCGILLAMAVLLFFWLREPHLES